MVVKVYKVSSEAYNKIRIAVGADHFARNGYNLKDGKTLGEEDGYVLYVEGSDEFFKEHEKEVLIEGVTDLQGENYDRLKKAIEEEENNVASGIGLFD